MRLALAQINATVGDLAGNLRCILDAIESARRSGADLIVFPEMAIPGYPPEDLLLKPHFVKNTMQVVEELAPATVGLTVIVGTAFVDIGLYNGAVVLHDGHFAQTYRKQFLPNYGVFDEGRYFRPGQNPTVFRRDEYVFGVTICEDIWYPDGPAHEQAVLGKAELLINISASPYHRGKGSVRERMLATRASDNCAYVAYCNLVGGQDELVFDGQSLIFDPEGRLVARGRAFETDLVIADLDFKEVHSARLLNTRRLDLGEIQLPCVELPRISPRSRPEIAKPPMAEVLDDPAEVYSALRLGTRDYLRKNKFKKALLGISGGIDSALTAAIAVDAIGSKNVVGVAMPTRFSSSHSLEDARVLANNLGIEFVVLPIDGIFQSFLDLLQPVFKGHPPNITEENLQPRIRGMVLMAMSNKYGYLVLTTGNKSEVSVGYSTLYGDTAGGFAVIKDVPKMLVYELSRYRNRVAQSHLIPPRIFEKAPSAELAPGQKDSDSLPEYPLLDRILVAYVEQRRSIAEIVALGFSRDVVERVIRLVDLNEYKRRQSPPGPRISHRAFGKDWRVPITKSLTSVTSSEFDDVVSK